MSRLFRPLPVLTAFSALALVILVSLGTWQLQRRAEKHELLAQIELRRKAPPAPIEVLFPTGDYAALRKATATGEFDHDREAYVFSARTDKGPTLSGFKVITPFKLSSGDIVLVDRGWVPTALREPRSRLQGQTKGQIEIEGVLRRSAIESSFTPPPDPSSRIFYSRNSAMIAKVLDLPLKSTLIFEAVSLVPGGPEPIASTATIPDNHLSYALTWYSLALVLIAVYLRFHHTQGRLRFRV